MSLQVWLPLDGNLNNYGTSNITIAAPSPTINNSGKTGKCYECNNSHYIKITQSLPDLYNFSFSFWMKIPSSLASVNAWNMMFSFRAKNFSSSDTINTVGVNWASYNNIKIYDDANHQHIWMAPGNQFNYDVWSHYTITHTGNSSSCTIKIYTDGILRGSYTSNNRLALVAGDIYLGSGINPSYGPLYFSDFRLYDECLSAGEIKEISRALVLHYPLNDSSAEATTNIYPGWSGTCYNGVNGKYGYGSETDIYYTSLPGNVKKVYTGTNFSTNWPFVFFGNLTPSVSGYKTLSFDYYPAALTGVNFYSYNTSGSISWILNGQAGTGGNITGIIPGRWNHIEVTIKNTGSATSGFGYMRIGISSHTTSASNYWLFKCIQIEEKDHATEYTLGTRAGGIVPDCSGYNRNGIVTASTCPIIAEGSPRSRQCYQFDGANQAVQIPFNNAIPTGGDGIFTMNVWTYHDSTWSSKNWETIFGGPSGFELEMKNSSTNSPVLYAYSWNKGNATYELNKWNMITMVRTASDTKFFINGELKFTGTAGTLPAGNYFIGSWRDTSSQNYKGKVSDFKIYATALSADDIAHEYHTFISIYKNGSLSAYDFSEV